MSRHTETPVRTDARRTEDEEILQETPEYGRDIRRLARITGEFAEGFSALMGLGPAVTVFGSARTQPDDPYYEKAVDLGRSLAGAGYAVITGGGPGIMEAANKGAAEVDPERSVGLGIELPFEASMNPYCTRLSMEFRYFFVRKVMLVKPSDAFIIAPGGFGSCDEAFEIACLRQTHKMPDVPIVFYGREFWGGLFDWMKERMEAEGMISPGDLDALYLVDTPAEVLEAMRRHGGGDR